MEPNLVSLYRCKKCGIRVFERDAIGHLRRHGYSEENWRGRFVKGKKDTSDRPGSRYTPIHCRTKKKGVKPPPADLNLN